MTAAGRGHRRMLLESDDRHATELSPNAGQTGRTAFPNGSVTGLRARGG
jgi:hypothetical protein